MSVAQRRPDGTLMPGAVINPLGRGAAKRRDEAERAEIIAGLLADLGGHKPSMTSRIAIENIAGLQVEVPRLEAQGKDASDKRRLIAQWMRTANMKPAPAAPVKPDPTRDVDELFAEIAADREAQR